MEVLRNQIDRENFRRAAKTIFYFASLNTSANRARTRRVSSGEGDAAATENTTNCRLTETVYAFKVFGVAILNPVGLRKNSVGSKRGPIKLHRLRTTKPNLEHREDIL